MTELTAGLSRSAQIIKFLIKYRSADVFSGLDVDEEDMGQADASAETTAEHFVSDLEALGPTFIKIGQALSTRPDMVPHAYLVALERIQDDVMPISFDQVREVVESEFGLKIGQLFAEFDESPLGSASLAQVHRARLRNGRQVAVKVQRPNILTQIHGDLNALTSLADKADHYTEVGRRIKFSEWVYEFRKSLLAELDYRIEAENLERFQQHFENYPKLFVPQPIWDYTTGKVLTMDLVEGVKATDISSLRRLDEDFSALGKVFVQAYLDQVFVHGDIHADPHPGNVLITKDGDLALIDLGMIAHVPPKRRDQLIKLMFAAVDGRGEDVAAIAIAMSTRLADFEHEKYVREVGQMVARYVSASGARGQSEGRLLLDVTVLGMACGLRSPPELSLLGKTLLSLEAVSQALDPDLDVKEIVKDHLEHVMRERLKHSLSPGSLAGDAMELQALVRESPQKISQILGLLAENRLQMRVTGFEDSLLVENLQKIANRISAGVITAALILASAMMMGHDGGVRLFGYPALAMILFMIASGLGLTIVLSSILRDRSAKPTETRGTS